MGERLNRFADWIIKGDPNHPARVRLQQVDDEIAQINGASTKLSKEKTLVNEVAKDFKTNPYGYNPDGAIIGQSESVMKWNKERLDKLEMERSVLMKSLGIKEKDQEK